MTQVSDEKLIEHATLLASGGLLARREIEWRARELAEAFLSSRSHAKVNGEPGRIPELEPTRINADYWIAAARNADTDAGALISMEQAVNAWKNAAYAAWDKINTAADMLQRAKERGELTERERASALSTTPQKTVESGARTWEWPINTVGRLVANLNNMPPEMPFYTAYFVEIDGVRVARTTHPSLSRETVEGNRVGKYDSAAQSLVMWATAYTPSATRCIDDLPLTCEAVGGVLDMRIGEKVLAFATENCPDLWDADKDRGRYRVTDAAVFAEAVAHELNKESEDGRTPLSRLLDEVVEEAINQGAEGVEENNSPDGGVKT